MSVYDLIIAGAGPAGITASVYAARKKMSFIIISKDVGGQAILSSDIENYTGYQFITGIELAHRFREHMEQFNIELKEGVTINLLEKKDKIVNIETDNGTYQSKTAIIATGRIPRKLGISGEDEFKNKGVTYCATCDGPLFLNKNVAVIGGGNSALDATLQLMKIANKIHLIDIQPKLRADSIMVEKAETSNKVVIYNNTTVKQISGDKLVNAITVEQQGKITNLSVEGVFIEIGSSPASDFAKDIEKNKSGEVIINCECETNIPGIFAAGDVTSVPAKQVIVACGEGAKSAMIAFEYLSKNK